MSKKSEEEASDAILAYLKKQNRPYSAVDIFSNLHKAYGKTSVQRCLETLSSNGTITEKVNGKQKVYAPKQDQFGEYDENEIKKMDEKIITCQQNLKKLQETLKSQESELRSLNTTLTTEDAKSRLSDLTKKCDSYRERIQSIKSASSHYFFKKSMETRKENLSLNTATNHISPEDKDQIYKHHRHYVQLWRKRKRLATDILNGILEGYPKSKKQLVEDIGIETDEEYGAVIPNI